MRPTELPVLRLQRLEPLPLIGREPRALPGVALDPADPGPQRLGRAADLLGNGVDGRPLRLVFARTLQYQAHRPLAHLRGERLRPRLRYAPNLSRVEASSKPGAIHRPPARGTVTSTERVGILQ